ncbi:MAG: leucine-rich repeat domain-containing protein [Bacteroidota bacterium]
MFRINIHFFLITVLLASLLVVLNPLFAQNNSSWTSLSDNISRPDTITSLVINFSDEENQYSLIDKFGKLEQLWLQEMQNEDIGKIKSLKGLVSLVVSNSPELDIEDLFKNSMEYSNIMELTLQGNLLDKLPAIILKFKNLKKISVTDNDDFDVLSLFDLCKDLPSLTTVYLSENRLSSLPPDIPVLNNIRVVSLIENLLETTGSFFNSFPNLDSLMLEGNMFDSPLNEIKKLKNNNIKYISVDSSVVYDEDWKTVKAQFVQTVFELIPDIPFANTIDPDNPVLPDSLSFSLKQSVDTSSGNSVVIGTFKLEKNTFRILSDAYLHYPRLFPLVNISFDSLLFEERFYDLDYINNVKKTRTFQKGRIQLSYGKKYSHTISFLIRTDQSYLIKHYNELSVYNDKTKWVYKNIDYKRTEFKKKFIGSKKKPVFWNDIKIEYNADNNEYVLVLKNDTTLFYLDCYIKKPEIPFSNNKKRKSEIGSLTVEKANLKKYLRYVKLRSSRESKVNKAVLKNKDLYQKTMTKYNNVNWLSFQQMYMSDDEKLMTKEQWLEYYEKVIANEPEAIRNSDASIDATERALDIDGYSQTYSALLINDTLPVESSALLFRDKDKNILAVRKALMILPDRQNYITVTGTFNSDYLQTILPLNEKIMFIVETVSGKTGVASAPNVDKAMQDGSKQYSVEMQMLNNKIATVGQIYNILLW